MTETLGDRSFIIVDEMHRCKTMAALAAATDRAVATVGMSAVACGMITGPRAAGTPMFHFQNWPAEWLAEYAAQGYAARDPTPRWAIVSGAPITWSELRSRLPRNDAGHDVYEAAARYGFREGLAVPVRTHEGNLGLVVAGGNRGRLKRQEQTFLQVVATAALHHAETLAGAAAEAPSVTLSPRERECAMLLAQGQSDRDMGAVLGISEATVRFHLDNARTKLGARSRSQLAALASGWLAR